VKNRNPVRRVCAAGLGGILALTMAACLDVSGAPEAGIQTTNLGKPGDPINLTIGYQPYYSEAWSGAAMRAEQFWEKYLPEGSNVEFQVGLQGSVIVTQMLAGKQQIGYVGDMPALVATSKRSTLPISLVATLGTAVDQCNIFLTVPDAPDFASPTEAVRWMDGKTVATPQGSCTDRFTQSVFRSQDVEPSGYLNQSIEVISSNFANGRIDAATVWEPVASHLVNQGLAKRVASGANFDERDAGFLVMSQELIDNRPDVVKAYLRAELDAQQWVAEERNATTLAEHAVQQTEGYTVDDMWDGMFREWPDTKGSSTEGTKLSMPFIVDEQMKAHIDKSWAFLHEIRSVPQATPPRGIVQDDIAREVLDQSPVEFPLTVEAQPERPTE
jgi:NitT/TauT family transport system substrate-binding protein